jgi:MoaA/NifB/PqqE/SkfB family radical SAM enzyme
MCACSESAKKYKGEELSTEEILNTIEQIVVWSKQAEVVFSGGEPFIRKDIFKLIDSVCRRKLKLSINTNGSFIDKVAADKLVSYPVYHINFSLDGDNSQTNDAIRGRGVFSHVLEALKFINEAKKRNGSVFPYLSLNVTMMKENITGISNFISLAKEHNVNNVFFQPVVFDNTNVQKENESICPNKAELDALINILKKVGLQAKGARINAQIPDVQLLSDYFMPAKNNGSKRKWRCFVGYSRMSISSFGHVYSCSEKFGEIRENTLKEIWYSKKAAGIRKKFNNCRKFCLQTCYARPDSESLYKVIRRLFKKER